MTSEAQIFLNYPYQVFVCFVFNILQSVIFFLTKKDACFCNVLGKMWSFPLQWIKEGCNSCLEKTGRTQKAGELGQLTHDQQLQRRTSAQSPLFLKLEVILYQLYTCDNPGPQTLGEDREIRKPKSTQIRLVLGSCTLKQIFFLPTENKTFLLPTTCRVWGKDK